MPESSGTSEEAEQTLKALQDSWEQALKPLSEEAEQSFRFPLAIFMGGYTAIGGLALGGGVVMGMRSFEDTVAYEALDKLEKPTPRAEQQAMRMAVRALGWGTVLCWGSAGLAVLAVRQLGVRSAADFGDALRTRLKPADDFLVASASWANETGKRWNRNIDGFVASAVRGWQWWRPRPAAEAAPASQPKADEGA